MEDDSVKCAFLTMSYLMTHGRNINSGPFENDDLFPFGWYTEISDKDKCDILSEAIDKKIKIHNTDLYKEHVSDVKIDIK